VRMLWSPHQDANRPPVSPAVKIGGGLGIGVIIGFLGGLLGIGGGVFVVPLLIYLLHTPARIAAASSTFIVCFSSLTGFLGYASLEGVDWGFILPAAAASLLGGQIGARLMSTKLQGRHVRILFSLVLFTFCAKLLQQFFT